MISLFVRTQNRCKVVLNPCAALKRFAGRFHSRKMHLLFLLSRMVTGLKWVVKEYVF